MVDIILDLWKIEFYRKFVLAIVVLLLYAISRGSIDRLLLPRIPDDSPHLVTICKITGYLVNTLATARPESG